MSYVIVALSHTYRLHIYKKTALQLFTKYRKKIKLNGNQNSTFIDQLLK